MTTTSATTNTLKDPSSLRDPGEVRDQISFIASNKPVDRASSDCVWIGLFSTDKGVELSGAAKILDKAINGVITKLLSREISVQKMEIPTFFEILMVFHL